jgi:magnesium chelatase family protein
MFAPYVVFSAFASGSGVPQGFTASGLEAFTKFHKRFSFRRKSGTRAIQRARSFYNAQMPRRHIRKLCTLDEAGERTLEMAVRRMGLSARAHDRILKLSRTIADLGESKTISAKHVAEAVQYRSLDRNYWN